MTHLSTANAAPEDFSISVRYSRIPISIPAGALRDGQGKVDIVGPAAKGRKRFGDDVVFGKDGA